MRILSLDGGGYLGLATAAFIAEAEDHHQARFHDQFDMFCGTSTGAIIALGLAKGMSGQEIVELYKRLGPDVFPVTRIGRYFRAILAYGCARYGDRELAGHLNGVFGDATLGSVLASGKSAIVTAYSLTTGKPRVFKTDHHETLTRDSAYRLADIALASSAAPTYFPIASITSPANGSIEWFADGGVVANNPGMLGFSEAIGTLKCHPPDVMLLSIGTPRESHAVDHRKRKRRRRGVFGWGPQLASILIDGPSSVGHEMADRVVHATGGQYVRIALANPSCLALDDASPGATISLESLGRDRAAQRATRLELSPFFASLPSN